MKFHKMEKAYINISENLYPNDYINLARIENDKLAFNELTLFLSDEEKEKLNRDEIKKFENIVIIFKLENSWGILCNVPIKYYKRKKILCHELVLSDVVQRMLSNFHAYNTEANPVMLTHDKKLNLKEFVKSNKCEFSLEKEKINLFVYKGKRADEILNNLKDIELYYIAAVSYTHLEKEIEEKFERFNKNKKRKILYLSNLMKEKGILEVLKVSEKFNEDEIEFNLAGAIEPEIKDIVEEYLKKYPNKLIYHGIVNGEKKRELLLNNDIFILPTYYSNEGQPISILEAYVTGCSVITTNQGGICDVFQNEINGISCIAKDIESIYSAIEKIKNDNSFIKSNYKYGIENFKKENFVKRIEKIIEKR